MGDEPAFARLYQVVAPRLYGLALRILRENSHAEEVTQEAFVAIWSTSAQYDPARGSAMGWMLTIVHRRAVDRVRSTQSATRRNDAWTQQHPNSTGMHATYEAAHASIEGERVRAALRSLPAKQRTAIFLAYFAGQTHTQVATTLGIPHGTAKTRIRDGLRALANTLATSAASG
ncbi:RNA polymerase sigma factor [Janibacter sp. HTCC2649]|nr:RNA polymerase sigma factor [Janibacter sp. HTCC2649]